MLNDYYRKNDCVRGFTSSFVWMQKIPVTVLYYNNFNMLVYNTTQMCNGLLPLYVLPSTYDKLV